MAQPNYCVVVNPAAGGGRAGRELDALLQAMAQAGLAFDCHTSQGPGGCRQLARDARRDGHSHFLSVGGDGTANEVVNGVFAAGTGAEPATLAVAPWGTGNDWAAYYDLPSNVDDIVALLHAGNGTPQDVGRARFTGPNGENEHFFVNCIGTGFDSFLLAEMGTGGGSRLRYLRYVLKCLGRYHANPLTLELPGGRLTYRTLMLEVCLGRYAGAGMHLAPGARTDDGAFEVVLVENLGIWELLKSLHYLYNGRIYDHPRVHHAHCDHLRLSGDRTQRFHCDGELVGALPVELDVIPGGLTVLGQG